MRHFKRPPTSPKKESTGAVINRLQKSGFDIDESIIKSGKASKIANAAKESMVGKSLDLRAFATKLDKEGIELHNSGKGYNITFGAEATVDYVRTLSSF